MKVEKVWNDNSFLTLNSKSKLLYLYLVTHPSQSELGVLILNPKLTTAQLNYTNSEFRDALISLRNSGKVTIIKADNEVYFIVNDYYNKSAKSHSLISRLKKKLSILPEQIQDHLKNKLDINLEIKEFKLPTVEDVETYAKEKGYNVNGSVFIEYYTSMADTLGKNGFYDKNGKRVVDWKAKMRKVWFRDDNKLVILKDAPKGFETLHVVLNKKTYYPMSWVDGKPKHNDFTVTKKLQEVYEKESKGSRKVSEPEAESNTRRRRQSTSDR